MFPVHHFSLYPQPRNQMQSALHPCPNFEAIPPQMRGDPDRSYYQSWPCSSNYGYACPAQCHGCCEHNHFRGYCELRSPYAQPAPPYYYGSYPVPSGAYPFHYFPPPPHHTVELPHYGYDKDMNGYYHCCGCLHHPSNRKANVKIEEESPHLEKKVDEWFPFNFRSYPNPVVWNSPNNIKNNDGNRSNEPWYEKQEDGSNSAKIQYPCPIVWFPPNYIRNKEDNTSNEPQYEKQGDGCSSVKTNYPYPFFWLPSTYVRNKEDSVSNEPQYEKQEGSPNGSKTYEIAKPSEQQQKFVNGWFPFDMNNFRAWESRSVGQQHQQQGDDEPGFPFPVFWMPYKPDERESKDDKKTGAGQECAQSHVKVSPVVVRESEDTNNRDMNKEIIDQRDPKRMEKTNNQKTIPVKQVELNEEKKNEEKTKTSGTPLNFSEAGKSSEDAGKRESSSSPKSSKLPPVCLRVDPLPKKKKANGSSRSPSPPGDKEKSHGVSGENANPATTLDAKESSQQDIPSGNSMVGKAKDKEQHKSKIKTIQVAEGTESQARNGDVATGETNCRPRDAIDDVAAGDVKSESVAEANNEGAVTDKSVHFSCQIDDNEEKSMAEQKPANKEKEPKRINLSEAEAARKIQSAYRGYEVRRWEPLKKLKQVMEVRKKVAELKSSIQAFEPFRDIEGVDRWRTVIGETIMNLLLKLDTIQGMDPCTRDIRKSVARELVGLQEKVDYLTQRKAETLTQQASRASCVENMDTGEDLCIKEGEEKEKPDLETNLSEVACQGLSTPSIEAVTKSGDVDIPEIVKDDDVNPRDSITRGSITEIELLKGGPRIDAFTNSENLDTPVLFMDEGKCFWEPVAESSFSGAELQKSVVATQVGGPTVNPSLTCSSLTTEVSGKEIEELPEGGLSKDACMLDDLSKDASMLDDLVQANAWENRGSEDELLMNELPKGVLDENTGTPENIVVKNDAGKNGVLIEPSENTCVQDNLVESEGGEDRVPKDEVLMNDLTKCVHDENADFQDNNLVENNLGEYEVLAESYSESKELEQLPQGVLDDDDESNKHLHAEEEEEKGETDAVMVGVDSEVADTGFLNINQGERVQGMTLEVPLTSEVNENLGCVRDEDNNDELLEMVDVGSKDAIIAPEEETCIESKAVDGPQMHDEKGTGSVAEVINCAKSEVSGYLASENEMPANTTATEPEVVSETCEVKVAKLSSMEIDHGYTSGGENRLRDADNSLREDTSQECYLPVEPSKSCEMKSEEKQLNDNFELQASGGAAGVDITLAEQCDSGALERKLSDDMEAVPMEAWQAEEKDLPPSSPAASQISGVSDVFLDGDKKLIEENVRLREMMQKLIEAGQEQLTSISNLSARVKDLEKRISKKKKLKARLNGTSRSSSGSSGLKPSNDPLKEIALAM